MSDNVSDFLVKRLIEWKIKRIYGYPGDGINGILGAMGRAGITSEPDSKIQYVQVRHEEMAAFMACAHSKFTGEVGVCLATSGPGAIHLLNGLYDAKMDHQSVVAIVGQQARRSLGSHYQQEVDLATCSSRTWRPSTSCRPACPSRCARWWTAPCASPRPSAPSPA